MLAKLILIAILSTSTALSNTRKTASADFKFCASKAIGQLNLTDLPEESGIAFSSLYQRFYHVNDSGNLGELIITDLAGKTRQKVRIENFTALDTEEVAYGDCFDGKKCILIADIGISRGSRKGVPRSIAIIEEKEQFSDSVEPLKVLQIAYPSGLDFDAESMAIHPRTHDLFFITKNYNFEKKESLPNEIYKIPAESWMPPTSTSPITLQKVADFDLLPLYAKSFNKLIPSLYWAAPTSMAISPDGEKFIVLNYMNAFEFKIDLSKDFPKNESLKKGRDFEIINLLPQAQQESITYLNDGKSFVYSSEKSTRKQTAALPQGELIQVTCD